MILLDLFALSQIVSDSRSMFSSLSLFPKPGPVPGMRPPVGGAGHIPTGPKGGGTMGIIMPMYTIGIVCFFLYTIMKVQKVLFRIFR